MSSAGSHVNGNRRNNNNNTASSNRRSNVSGNNLQRLIEMGEREINQTRRTRATAARLNRIQRHIDQVRRFQARLRRPRRIPAPRSPHRATGPTASGSGRTNSHLSVGMVVRPAHSSNVSNNILRLIRHVRDRRHRLTPAQSQYFLRVTGPMLLHISRRSRRARRWRTNNN